MSICTGETIGASYQLEYGEDRIEMHKGHVARGQRVVLIDDLIATGGTLAAGIKLMVQVCDFDSLCTAGCNAVRLQAWVPCAGAVDEATWHDGSLLVLAHVQAEAEVVECACVIELPDLKGKAKLSGLPLYVQVQREGD